MDKPLPSPIECIRLLKTVGLSFHEISKESGVPYDVVCRVQRGQNLVDYRIADKLRVVVQKQKNALIALQDSVKGALND